MLNFLRVKPKIKLDKDEAAALLFHFHKNGIPPSQTAAKELERRLCEFVGVETKDEYVAPCAPAHGEGKIEGKIEGEDGIRSKLRSLRRENECVGGDQTIVNSVRKIEDEGVL